MSIKTGSPTSKLILIKLADNANEKGECWPSLKNISEQCEVSQKTVVEHIKKLEKLGFVEKTNRFNKNGKTSNLYKLNIQEFQSKPCEESSTTHVKNRKEPCEESSTTPYEDISHESVSSFNQSIEPVSQERLKEFIDHRKKIKKPMTDLAITKFKNKLTKLKSSGYDIDAMLDDAIINGWQSVVEKQSYKKSSNVIGFNKPDGLDFDDEKPSWMWG